jgi:hypothetical protein
MSWSRLGLLLTVFTCLIALAAGAPLGVAVAQEGQASITAPQADAQVAGTVQIIGSATHPAFQRYELAWAAEPATDDAWAVFASVETPIEDGILGTWNTTQVPDGPYALRLRVVRQDGNYAEAFVRQVRIANSRPVETPTPPIGPTIPPEMTSEPVSATPELIIQPPTSTPSPPTPTPSSDSPADADTLSRLNPTSFSINLDVLRQAFCNGITYTFALFLLWGAVLGARGFVHWILRRITRQPVNK